MIILSSLVCAAFFVVALWRTRAVNLRSKRRQRVLAWPRAVAYFDEGTVPKLIKKQEGLGIFSYLAHHLQFDAPFRYRVRGTEYAAYRLCPRKNMNFGETNDNLTRCLNSSERWKIWYNPEDPREAYLSPGVPGQQLGDYVFALFFLFIAPAVMLYNWYGWLTHNS